MRVGISLLVVASLLAGCEKAGPKSSGKLSEDERALMARLPNKFGLALGGNLPRLQSQLAKSPMMKFARAAQGFEGSNAWQDCLADKQFKHMFAVADVRHSFELRMVMTGIDITDLEGCAEQAKLVHRVDSDRKFISIEVGTQAGQLAMPYLVLDDGALYARVTLGRVGSTPKYEALSRAQMEADITAAKSDNATQNEALIASMEKADRQKGMWFAGSVEGTPIGDQAREVFGTMDLDGGLEIDATIEMMNAATTKKIMDGIQQARDAGGMLGSEIKHVLDALEVKRDGDRVRFVLKVTNAQLDAVFAKLAPLMGKRE